MLTNFTIFSWDDEKCKVVKESLIEARCAIVCSEEIKWNTHSLFRLRKVCPYYYANPSFNDANNSAGGTLIAWNPAHTTTYQSSQTFTNTVILTNSSGLTFMLTNAYRPIDSDKKLDFLVRSINDLPWILLGDFNLLRSPSKTTGEFRSIHHTILWNNMIQELQLNEVPLLGRLFTYSNKRPSPTLSKLDRILLSHHRYDEQFFSFIAQLSDLPKIKMGKKIEVV